MSEFARKNIPNVQKIWQFTTIRLLLQCERRLHSIGMSPNIRKGIGYQELNYDFYAKTLDISALSYHKLLQTLYKKDAPRKGGSVVALSYIAGDRAIRRYGDMADAKAMLQSITRNFGIIFTQERGVRVNTISQSPTMTTAGQGILGAK